MTMTEENASPKTPAVYRRDFVSTFLVAAGGLGLGSLGAGAAETAANGQGIAEVDTMAGLRALGGSPGQLAFLKGFAHPGDGGGGIFCWSDIAAKDDGGTVINATAGGSASGWRRLYSGPRDVRWFGARGDGTTPASDAIQAAIDSCAQKGGGKIFFPSTPPPGSGTPVAVYSLDKPLAIMFNTAHHNAVNITLSGETEGAAGDTQAQFQWAGSPKEPMLQLYSGDCVVENMMFNATKPALCAIDITLAPEPNQICTNNTIRNINIRGSMVYGIKLGDKLGPGPYPANCEQMKFEYVFIELDPSNYNNPDLSVAGYYIPNNSGQNRNEAWIGGYIANVKRGIWAVSIGGYLIGVEFGLCRYGVWLDSQTDYLNFSDCSSEGMERFIWQSGQGSTPYNICVRGGSHDIQNLPSTGEHANIFCRFTGTGPYYFDGVWFENPTKSQKMYIQAGAPNHGCKVTMRNCVLPYPDWALALSLGVEFSQQGCVGWDPNGPGAGMDFPVPDSLGTHGRVIISGSATSATVTLPPAATGYGVETGLSFPGKDYLITNLTVGKAAGTTSVAAGALRASYEMKTPTSFVIVLEAAPGEGNAVEVAWAVGALLAG